MKSVPFFIRFLLRLRLEKMLEHGMPRGVRIPGISAGTTGQRMSIRSSHVSIARGVDAAQHGEPCTHDSPAFGALSQADRIRLNLRHAELHLGYMQPS